MNIEEEPAVPATTRNAHAFLQILQNDHTRIPPSSCIWLYGTPTLRIYSQQDVTAIGRIFKFITLLCTSDAPHHRVNNHQVFQTRQWPWNKRSVDNSFWKRIWKPRIRWHKTGAKGTNSLFLLTHQEIREILTNSVVTYGIFVVDYLPQKDYQNRVRLTAGGNLITYPGNVITCTNNLTTFKILSNSVLSTYQEKYMWIDIRKFTLARQCKGMSI